MKILAISPFFPYPPDHGGRIRTYLLLRELARLGHAVHLIPLIEREGEKKHVLALAKDEITTTPVLHPRRFGRLCIRDRLRKGANLILGRSDVLSRFWAPAALLAARSLDIDSWDVVLSELLWTAPLALAIAARSHVLNAHNVETVIARRTAADTGGLFSRGAAHLEARGMHRDEARLVSRFDSVVVVSEEDRRHMQTLVPAAELEVIGNCVDTDVLKVLEPRPPKPHPSASSWGVPTIPRTGEPSRDSPAPSFPW